MKYLLERCKDENMVYRQFRYFGIGRDLKKFSDEQITHTEPEKMPRYIIANEKVNAGKSKF